jgi:hypothetical protein
VSGINHGTRSVFSRIANNHPIKLTNAHGNQTTLRAFKTGIYKPIQTLSPAGILGPKPLSTTASWPFLRLCSACLGPTHDGPFCTKQRRCRLCLHFGHDAGRCGFTPGSSRHPPHLRSSAPSSSGTPALPLNNGPRIYRTFPEYISHLTGTIPPSPIVVPWCCTWRLKVPDFVDDDEATSPDFVDDDEATSPALLSAVSSPLVCSSFGEFAN